MVHLDFSDTSPSAALLAQNTEANLEGEKRLDYDNFLLLTIKSGLGRSLWDAHSINMYK